MAGTKGGLSLLPAIVARIKLKDAVPDHVLLLTPVYGLHLAGGFFEIVVLVKTK